MRTNPAQALREAGALAYDMRLLVRWGQVVQPTHEDTLPVPDVEDIEIL